MVSLVASISDGDNLLLDFSAKLFLVFLAGWLAMGLESKKKERKNPNDGSI